MRALRLGLAVVASCSTDLGVQGEGQFLCVSDATCPKPLVCVVDVGRCRPPGAACIEEAEGVFTTAAVGNRCDAEGSLGVCRAGQCERSVCGDGIVDAALAEECDDGPANSDTTPDACRSDCTLARCGDGVIDDSEICDRGPSNADDVTDACRLDCTPARCGDGTLDTGEDCDSGALASDTAPDTCRTDCTAPRCGDRVTDAGEDCDDGDNDDQNDCTNACLLPTCGDAIVWSKGLGVETCDDGDTITDPCPYSAQSCGVCSSVCQIVAGATSFCGDGVVDVSEGETCDDANLQTGDGCDGDCIPEPDFTCFGAPSECVVVLFVDASVAGGTGDGSSWTNAFADVQPALDAAFSISRMRQVELWVAAGTYVPSLPPPPLTGARNASYVLYDNLAVYGGFAGDEVDRSARDWLTNVTVFSGDINGDDGPSFANRTDNLDHVLRVQDTVPTLNTVLDGVTVSGGEEDNSSGAALTMGAPHHLLARNVTFADNRARQNGGAVALFGTTTRFENCTFAGNRAGTTVGSVRGGAMVLGGSVELVGCTFEDNVADNGLSASGGAIAFTTSAVVSIAGTRFENNFALNTGGAIALPASTGSTVSVTVSGSTFVGNEAMSGGAIYATNNGAFIVASRFEGNRADDGAGLFATTNAGVIPRLVGCTFVGNAAMGDGGGLWIQSDQPRDLGVNLVFIANSAGRGGGLYASGGGPRVVGVSFLGNMATFGGGVALVNNTAAQLTNVVLSGNAAATDGGGAWASGAGFSRLVNVSATGNTAGNEGGALHSSTPGGPTLTNAIATGNAPTDVVGAGAAITYSCIGGDPAGMGNLAACVPGFLDPAGNDGTSGTLDDDLRLSAGSPCIDTGNNAEVPGGVALDVGGLARFVDDPAAPDGAGSTAPVVDMGAHERP